MRRHLLRLLTVATVIGTGAALAPGLSASPGGEPVQERCDFSQMLEASWGLAEHIGYVDTVQVDGLAESCKHHQIKIDLQDGDGRILASARHEGPQQDGSVTVSLPEPVPAAALEHVTIVVGGAQGG